MEAASQEYDKAIALLREFGYGFNASGQLRQIDATSGEPGEKPFEFKVSEDFDQNQRHYEKLGDIIQEIVYGLLEKNGLKRLYIPFRTPAEQASFVFTQPEEVKKSKKLLVLINGSGVVRAGQWARSLIINHSLDHGSQLPYIQRAQELGYDIVVTNTNDNERYINGKFSRIEGVATALDHANYAWEHIVMASDPESVAIVAHSYGGYLTIQLSKMHKEFFKKKVFAIALTDSSHGSLPDDSKEYLRKVACNWASSEKPLDAKLPTSDRDVPRISAGHPKHEWSSYAAMESVMKYFEQKYEQFTRE
ncbi:FAM172 family protein homolog CG10038-like [Scaptodrosophila lebanonensis]|uniref:FAM172 family protein homolog CG10038-like n=1 Tax=Drosophila lebanonensis TaxID=7225 RepID=A0A6J2TCJ1_DROLE|nr:FAM172 family protein homolog CG10038-like [Scaptodrosophila lebanonensis]